MNNYLSCGGLVDAKISASEKDLPVQRQFLRYYKNFEHPRPIQVEVF